MTAATSTARYGFIAELLDDPMIEEIIVIGGERTFIVRNGVKELVNIVVDQNAVRRIADQLLAGTGRRIDQANPIVSAQLPSGSRVHITGPPVTHANRMNIQIRRFVIAAADLGHVPVNTKTVGFCNGEYLFNVLTRAGFCGGQAMKQ